MGKECVTSPKNGCAGDKETPGRALQKRGGGMLAVSFKLHISKCREIKALSVVLLVVI